MLIALDPGMNSPGIALFAEPPVYNGTRELYAAARFNTLEYKDLPDGERWLRVARVLSGWVHKYIGGPLPLLTVVFERPQWYQRGKSKGDPNQLAGIAGVAANLTGILSCHYFPLEIVSPKPAEWIGQLPKMCHACGENKKKCPVCHGSAWNTPRGKRIQSRLNAREFALVPDQNDAIDAVGLGLWASGRLVPHQVFSNGKDGR